MFSPGQFSSQNSSPTSNGYNFFQSSVDSNRVSQPSQNKVISSDQARSIFSGKDPATRKQTYETMKSQGYTFEDEKAPAPAPEQGYLDTAIQGVKDFGAGVSAAGTQAAGGVLSIASDIVAAPFSDTVSYGGIFRGDNTGGPGQFFRDETKRQLAQGAESFGANTNNLTYNVGKTGAGIGLSIAAPGGVLGKAKDVGMLGKIGLGATQGAIETAKFNALTEGRIGTAGELATGAAIGGALPVIGVGLGKTKDYLTTKLPESLIATGIATPSKLLNASERLNKLGDPSFQDATSVSKWLLGNKIAGDLEQRTTQLADLAKTSRETAQTLLKGNTTTVADDIALQAKKGLETLRTKLEGAGLDKYVSYIDDALAKGTWTAEDLNKARTFMADKGGIFKHSGDWVDSLQKENLQDIWKASSKYLDETIPGFRAANKDYEVASALGEAIKLKQAQDIGRQVFSLVNLTGAGLGGTIGGIATGGDPISILKGAALGVGGRYIFSPSNMSKLALKLSEYAPKTEAGKIAKAIEAFVVSRGSKEIPTKYVDIIKSAAKTNKGVITPKPTQIINLPKKPLISRVQEVAKKLDMSKNTKGFINPSAMAEDISNAIKKSGRGKRIGVGENSQYFALEDGSTLRVSDHSNVTARGRTDRVMNTKNTGIMDDKTGYGGKFKGLTKPIEFESMKSILKPSFKGYVDFGEPASAKQLLEGATDGQILAILRKENMPYYAKVLADKGRYDLLSKIGITKEDFIKAQASKNTKGFINPTAMAEDIGPKAKDSTKALMEEARKYKSAEEFVDNFNIKEKLNLDEGLQYIKNYRLGKGIKTNQNVTDLKNSIEETGSVKPIEIDKNGFIVDGEHRYKALKELGVENIPVFVGKQLGETGRLEKGYNGLRQDVIIPKLKLIDFYK